MQMNKRKIEIELSREEIDILAKAIDILHELNCTMSQEKCNYCYISAYDDEFSKGYIDDICNTLSYLNEIIEIY